ncbi:S8 family serine peptidase [Pseudomarimonas salicorniae]|uniref:S8 family serine peptidase n=1 Tax=Pseudomarimonas salicorniae TaxID=2933270 RepID=A0ABT0GLE0_9GAMM|nr:S8 family serine peptidase [Lysobacter sp. CAU 1642]MCK7595202.1 S8 family serine peptidase [Lysobacter sp. CAU 1642]
MPRPIATLILLAAATLAPCVNAAPAAGEADYIVILDSAPIASFRGPGDDPRLKAAGLKATSPAATGARRLDMKSAEVLAYRFFLQAEREAVRASAESALGRALHLGFEYDVALHGFTTALSAEEAERLRSLPGVALVQEDWVDRLQTDAGPAWIGADAIWNGQAGTATRGEGVVVGIVDSGINSGHPSFAEVSPGDGFRHSNPRGQRYGVCLTQPTLCNDKLIGIHDFSICTGTHSGNGCDDREPNDGSDPDGHGTHVAATAAGNVLDTTLNLSGGISAQLRLSGVAPRANLIAYKACEDEETCRGSWLVAAINQATADGVDVFNYSIGGSIGTSTPWTTGDSLAMLNAVEAGVVVVTSAGNGGPGPGTVSRPADAPWVVSVANSSHDRAIANRLVDLTGGSTAPPNGGVLVGDAFTGGYGPADLVVPTDFPLCSQGQGLDSPPTGASNPWPAGRFNGQIVVCLRGITARVAKSNNVRLAGGGGMVLVNQAAEGESTVADEHSIPATHIGFSDGQRFLQWLGSGSGHRGRLEGTRVISDPLRGDVLNASSSRGPIANDYLKPDVSAPGTSVLAAAGTGNGFRFLTGTSMASPHVTGLVALLRAQNPDWSVADVQSAVRSTAVDSITLTRGGVQASPLEQGTGRVEAPAAAAMGLSFPLDGASLRASNPAQGGSPRSLNLPSLFDNDCRESCSFRRTVSDRVGGGRWRAVVEAPQGMEVSVQPASFTLAAGASQALDFTVRINSTSLLGTHASGRVVLQPVDAQDAPLAAPSPSAIPVTVFASVGDVPASINLDTSLDRGQADAALTGLVALDDISVAGTELVAPERTERDLQADPTRDSPYDGNGNGAFFTLVGPSATSAGGRFVLRARASSETAGDIDLYVGRDDDRDGQPDENEELCTSTAPDASEFCEIEVAAAASDRFWVLVQNFTAGSTGTDRVVLSTSFVDLAPRNDELVVTAPASSASGQPLDLRFAWNTPDLLPGERREGFLLLAAGEGGRTLLRVPVALSRGTEPGVAPRLLANGDRLDLRLSAGAAAESLAIDVPPGAGSLRASIEGTGDVSLHLSRVPFPAGPALGVAPPREQAVLSATGSGATRSLVANPGNGLQAGRWYITPSNTGSTVADFNLSVELSGSSASRPRVGAYFNPLRDGAGAFLFEAAGSWGLLWYTYLEDSTPTWYIASAPPPAAGEGQWRADLFRARWNGSEAPLTDVGEVVVTLDASESLQFGWNLDGASGSERYLFIDGGGCAVRNGAPFDINGFWFNPAQPGYGYSVNAFPGVETNGAYFFDDRGIARWALGSVAPFGGDTLRFEQRQGSCPSCTYAPPLVPGDIGQLVRRYDSEGSGNMSIDLQLLPPMSGRWQFDTPVQKLTSDTGCN